MLKIKKETLFSIIIVLAMLSWGGSWPAGKAIPEDTSLEVVIFWRFFITFITFIPIMFILKQKIKINKKGILQVLVGSLFLVAYNYFFLYGERFGFANVGGVMVTTLNPLLTFFLSVVILRQSVKRKEMLGFLLGLIGGAIIFIGNMEGSLNLQSSTLLFIFASLSWAILSVITQKSKEQMSAFVFSFYTYGIAMVVNFFFALPHGVFQVTEINPVAWFSILYLSLAATTFGITAYFYAASQLGARKASSFIFIVPVSAVFFSWLFLDEAIEVMTIVGGLIALIAVYIINYRKRMKS